MSNTFAALADPAQLALGEATVNQLAAPFALSLPGVSKHLKVPQRAGLIIQGRRAHWRPCTIDAVKLKDVSEWVEHYRSIWEERFARPSMSSHQMARALSIGPMTLVLELHVPEVTADLGGALLAQWLSYGAYIVSFATLGIIWVNHHQLFVHVRRVDRTLLSSTSRS